MARGDPRRGARHRGAARPARSAARRAAAVRHRRRASSCSTSSRERREHDRAELLATMRSDRYLALLDQLVGVACARRPTTRRTTSIDDLDATSSPTSCASRGASSAARSTRSDDDSARSRAPPGAHPRRSGAGTRRRRSLRRSARRRRRFAKAVDGSSRTCSASTRTRWSRATGCASTRDGRRRSSPASSPPRSTSPPLAAREQWPEVVEAGEAQEAPAVDVDASGRRPRRGRHRRRGGAADGDAARAPRAPPALRRLDASPRARPSPGSATRTPPSARSRRRPASAATLGDPAGETRYSDSKGRPKVVRYWVMTADRRPHVHAQPRGRRAALVHTARSGQTVDVRPRPAAPGGAPRGRAVK